MKCNSKHSRDGKVLVLYNSLNLAEELCAKRRHNIMEFGELNNLNEASLKAEHISKLL